MVLGGGIADWFGRLDTGSLYLVGQANNNNNNSLLNLSILTEEWRESIMTAKHKLKSSVCFFGVTFRTFSFFTHSVHETVSGKDNPNTACFVCIIRPIWNSTSVIHTRPTSTSTSNQIVWIFFFNFCRWFESFKIYFCQCRQQQKVNTASFHSNKELCVITVRVNWWTCTYTSTIPSLEWGLLCCCIHTWC